MEIRQLRYFLSAARLGGVGAAAAEHFVTQPAVSLQLKKLEEEAGQKLLIRRGRRLVPTEAGEVLIARAAEIVRSLELLEAELHGFRELETGTLRMGNTDAASVYVLPDLYRDFHGKYPGVRIEIMVGETQRLLDALAARRIEMATVTLPVPPAGLVVRPIYREELVVVVRPDDALASRRRVTLGDLVKHGVIAYAAGSVTRGMIDDVFAAHGEVLRARMEISSPEAMKQLAQAGLGSTILPRPVVAAELERKALKVVPVEGVHFEREIGLVHREDAALSPAAAVFLAMVEARFQRGHQKGR
ncbi:MAG TPA: LysR family transcriptional regulator [Candidatus Krumholzibacteria bacterium]|nr:LysR family transcriptional regulator [Candidatus Krumholzibacteria bacterium]